MDQLHFVVVARNERHGKSGEFVLREDNWNDYGYYTLFHLSYKDGRDDLEIGHVKIANAGMRANFGIPRGTSSTTELPQTFDQLGPETFSLGQDREYYEKLQTLPNSLGTRVLRALNDVAADESLFSRFASEDVFQTSLMRNLSEVTVETQFRRIIAGEGVLTPYRFNFCRTSKKDSGEEKQFKISFEVDPEKFPPTNMHVLIGPNGAGKSKLFRDFVATVGTPGDGGPGRFQDELGESGTKSDDFPFAGLVHVAFSAFENDKPATSLGRMSKAVRLVGLTGSEGETLEQQFFESLRRCKSGPRRDRWLRAMNGLAAADALLAETNFKSLLDADETWVVDTFSVLSSGHKIVILTMSRLVELIEERTMVLLDEPETHLHPPLLSALIRSISDLTVARNAVAVIATHSPVVLQEVPRNCVWMLRRIGDDARIWRLDTESFGESVSRLTSEVFHLEVGQTGYHQILDQLIEERHGSVAGVLEALNEQLGSEGRFVLNALALDYESDAQY